MHRLSAVLCATVVTMGLAHPTFAEDVFEDFSESANDRWEFIADDVMGGVSSGTAKIENDAIKLVGKVSTDNNGGFIQALRVLPNGLPEGTTGFELDVRGNDEAYYVFVRTKEMTRPWYFYNASFDTGSDWQTISLPLEAIKRSHAHLSEKIDPKEVISIGLVAYGRDYLSDLEVREIRLF